MTSELQQRPVAKRIGILIEELGDETVLYDPDAASFVRLNSTAYFVWQRCDGEATVADLVAAVEEEHAIVDAVEVVWLALDQLGAEGLLDGAIVLPESSGDDVGSGPMSRRTMLRLAGAGVALPVVASLIAPTAAAAASVPSGGGGGGGGDAVDCVVSAWSSYSPCTKKCGSGTQTRTRTVVTPAANGGAPCPTLSETTSCNEQPCPVDCQVSDWSPWSPCSSPCGGGTQTRTRTITTSPAFGGTPCPSLSDFQFCNNGPCP